VGRPPAYVLWGRGVGVGGGHWGHTVVPMEVNSGVRGRVRAAEKALEGDDRHTHTTHVLL